MASALRSCSAAAGSPTVNATTSPPPCPSRSRKPASRAYSSYGLITNFTPAVSMPAPPAIFRRASVSGTRLRQLMIFTVLPLCYGLPGAGPMSRRPPVWARARSSWAGWRVLESEGGPSDDGVALIDDEEEGTAGAGKVNGVAEGGTASGETVAVVDGGASAGKRVDRARSHIEYADAVIASVGDIDKRACSADADIAGRAQSCKRSRAAISGEPFNAVTRDPVDRPALEVHHVHRVAARARDVEKTVADRETRRPMQPGLHSGLRHGRNLRGPAACDRRPGPVLPDQPDAMRTPLAHVDASRPDCDAGRRRNRRGVRRKSFGCGRIYAVPGNYSERTRYRIEAEYAMSHLVRDEHGTVADRHCRGLHQAWRTCSTATGLEDGTKPASGGDLENARDIRRDAVDLLQTTAIGDVEERRRVIERDRGYVREAGALRKRVHPCADAVGAPRNDAHLAGCVAQHEDRVAAAGEREGGAQREE